jgi:hypothetical protein
LPRPLGSVNRKEPKNRIFKIRLTARERAEISILAKGTNHTDSDIGRSFIVTGLQSKKENIQKLKQKINCGPFYKREEPYFKNSSSSRINKSLCPSDRLDHKISDVPEEPVFIEEPEDPDRAMNYLAHLEKAVDNPIPKEWREKMHVLAEKSKGQFDVLVTPMLEGKEKI